MSFQIFKPRVCLCSDLLVASRAAIIRSKTLVRYRYYYVFQRESLASPPCRKVYCHHPGLPNHRRMPALRLQGGRAHLTWDYHTDFRVMSTKKVYNFLITLSLQLF